MSNAERRLPHPAKSPALRHCALFVALAAAASLCLCPARLSAAGADVAQAPSPVRTTAEGGCATPTHEPVAEWPSFRGNPAQTGVAACPLPGKLKLLWTYEAKDSISSTAAIEGGVVYVGTAKGRLLAINLATGRLKWQYAAEGEIAASPAVRDGVVFVGDRTGVFHAVNAATGAKEWTCDTEAEIDSSVNFSGPNLLFGSYDYNLYCLAAKTGQVIWKFKTNYDVHCSPCIAGGDAVIAGCDSQLRFIDLAKGTQTCRIPLTTEQDVASSPAFDGSRVYVSTCDGHLVCAEPSPARDAKGGMTLRKVWDIKADTELEFHASPAVSGDRVIFAGEDGLVRCLATADGHELWKFETRGPVDSSPVIADRRVFFGSGDGTVYAVDLSNGREVWRFRTGAPVASSPAVGEGRLVISAEDGAVYCFGTE